MTTIVHSVGVETRTGTIALTIDGKLVEVPKGATVLEAARRCGIYIPTLCYDPDLSRFGGCRLCVVEIEGMRGLTSACTTPAKEGMVVHTDTPAPEQSRRITMELIIANHHGDCLTCANNGKCDLQSIARYLSIDQAHFNKLRRRAKVLPIDDSHPAFLRDPNKCVLCGKCVRACHEIAGVGAIDLAFRGNNAKVSTLGDKTLVESTCESCGECLQRCPTGALAIRHAQEPTSEVRTICPYCGVGCSMYLGVRGGKIVSVRGDESSPVNKGGLCVKGRFGYDFVNHPDRLTKPLIRKEGYARKLQHDADPKDAFREATWDEALQLVATRLGQIKKDHGPDSIGVLSSAKFTNEENYLLQKFARVVIGTNNVDHCARLCHASTVVGAIAAFGSGAMSNSFSDLALSDLFFVIGSNTTDCHPMIGRRLRQSIRKGTARLIVADPRSIGLTGLADVHLQHKPGTDVALLNTMMHVIIKENLHDKEFVEQRTEGFEDLARTVSQYTPERGEEITGVPRSEIVRAARLFAGAKRAVILYGMGITQHTTGTDNVKSVANLLMLTGNMGREGTGFSPLRGQNNVQGSCDMGALPDVLPGYQRIDNPDVRRRFESAWKCQLSDKPGLKVTEMTEAASTGAMTAMYVAGENPLLSEPSLDHVRSAIERLEFLVVQEIFLTETAAMADVILPAAVFAEKDGTFTNTERRVQKLTKAIDPPGMAKPDWQIISQLAEKMGHSFNYASTSDITEEIAGLTPIYSGIHCDRLTEYGLQWPCTDRTHPGTPILHVGKFTRGKGKFHAVEYQPAAEGVSESYPLILTTGRVLEHWHTGSMSRRSEVLDKLRHEGKVDLHPQDAKKLGIVDGDLLTISSERGKVEVPVHITDKTSPGVAFMSFHWRESPVNLLTNTALDPASKIPEFKVSAVRAVLAVLDRAAEDSDFFSRLARNPSEALKEYDLPAEQKAAIASGDIRKIESWTGKLDKRLQKWLLARLQQEQW